MLEREKINFFDTTKLQETTGLEARANCTWLQGALNKAFPQEEIYIDQVQIVSDGTYQPGGKWVDKILKKKLTGLPKFVEVKLRHKTGDFYENIIVWSPFAWNDRFATTCGGGTGIGGESYITVPDNTSRGWTMGLALMNGFTAVTANAANTDGMHDFMVDSKTRKLHRELYDNWRAETTHNMTVIGKEIAKLLHNRPVKYSYIHGGSGGGRQTMMAVTSLELANLMAVTQVLKNEYAYDQVLPGVNDEREEEEKKKKSSKKSSDSAEEEPDAGSAQDGQEDK